MDRHVIAAISIAGTSLDFLGGMYLAYDLLGGEHGPLRTLTRAVTYGILFGAGYGIAFGPVFGLAEVLRMASRLAWNTRAPLARRRHPAWRATYYSACCGRPRLGLGQVGSTVLASE